MGAKAPIVGEGRKCRILEGVPWEGKVEEKER
jgi:hypothetical protein